MAFFATIVQKYSGDTRLGPTDTRDEASRLARAWIEAHAPAIGGGPGRQEDPVRRVDIQRAPSEYA